MKKLKWQLGKQGEDLACRYLQSHGYRILQRNFKIRYGELDIIAIIDKTLVFVEVKTRIGKEFGLPEEAVTPRKLREVTQTALLYKSLHPELPEALRIDVIGIELNENEEVLHLNHVISVTS